MISGTHVIVYSRDADADRELFREVLKLRSVDAGGGWLIFALPPAEVAFHPGKNDVHELYLMCADLRATMKALAQQGIACGSVSEERWGIRTEIRLPGGGRLGLYQPKHPTAVRARSARKTSGAKKRSVRR